MLESKGIVEENARRCFAEVSNSRHSPLVLVGAPMQGSCSPLVCARTKCSLRADSSTLYRGECNTPSASLHVNHEYCINISIIMITHKHHTMITCQHILCDWIAI